MTVKNRLRRMLGRKSRFRKAVDSTDVVSTSSSATTSSLSYEDDTASTLSPASGTALEDSVDDVYSDVRETLERLAARDKARFVQNHASASSPYHEEENLMSTFIACTTYLAYATFIFVGHVRDFFAWFLGRGRFVRVASDFPGDDWSRFAPLLKSWEDFYFRRIYIRVQDAFNRPIASKPGSHIDVLERVSDDAQKSMHVLGSLDNLPPGATPEEYVNGPHFVEAPDGSVCRQCLNLGSYNYLGFADDWHATCARDVMASLQDFSVSTSSARNEYGTTALHRQVETTVARFLGKEDAICLNMGFNTNATTIPSLVGRGDLLISDELNHTSIVNGARASGAAIRVFKHNSIIDLEATLKQAIILGRPRTRRPWNKILVIVEGIYSMEGEYCDLRGVVDVCKKYGAYIYLDEAHSIGATGATGRGCTEFAGVDTADVDILMGTFTKSFGAMGGYVAADRATIQHLRNTCAASSCHNALSPVVCQQVLTAFKVIMGEDGTNIGKQKLQSLRDNSNYFRMRLEEMGLQVLGQYDSPVMPIMLYNPCKIAAFSRECYKRGLAVVVVGFPAVPLLLSRARFCISAGHAREDLDRALAEIDEIAEVLKLRYARSFCG